MNNRYEIVNINDILNCVNENNLENFIIDFKHFLKTTISLNNLTKGICKAEGIPEERGRLELQKYVWIDDGKHNYSVKIETSNNNIKNNNIL